MVGTVIPMKLLKNFHSTFLPLSQLPQRWKFDAFHKLASLNLTANTEGAPNKVPLEASSAREDKSTLVVEADTPMYTPNQPDTLTF